MYRHGPALEATARDNRELPIVKEIFGSFQQKSYFAGVPPQGYGMPTNNNTTQQQQGQQYSMPLPPQLSPLQGAPSTSIYNMKMQLQDFPPLPNLNHQFQPPSCPPSSQTAMPPLPAMQQPRTAAAAAPSPPPGQYTSTGDLQPGNQGQNQSLSTSSSMPENAAADMVLPSGRPITASTGHGLITSLVTKELQSSTPAAPPAIKNKSSFDNGNTGGDGASIGSPPQLLGVQRDSWSLFFSAFVMPPAQADTLNGGTVNIPSLIDSSSAGLGGDGSGQQQQQCIYLGKFPTREQAGRAHDIAALKLYGNSANTNFPKETYATTLPVLHLHSEADVIAALQKDSALALQRTSKFKGVRRTGQGQFEARADLAVVSAGIDQNAIDAAAAAAAAANAATAAVAAVSSPQGF
jgi:hypothetical protein